MNSPEDPHEPTESYQPSKPSSSGYGEAFVKGGCGCIVLFLVIGLFFVLIGGHMRIDIGGAILLFVIGGIIGLVVFSIYNKGRRDGRG